MPTNGNILGEKADSLPDMACRLLRAVKLIPAALLSRVSVRNQNQQTRLAEGFQIPILDLYSLQTSPNIKNLK